MGTAVTSMPPSRSVRLSRSKAWRRASPSWPGTPAPRRRSRAATSADWSRSSTSTRSVSRSSLSTMGASVGGARVPTAEPRPWSPTPGAAAGWPGDARRPGPFTSTSSPGSPSPPSALAYVAGRAPRRSHGAAGHGSPPVASSGPWPARCVALVLALTWPLADLAAHWSLTALVVQRLLLTLAAAPLLLLAIPAASSPRSPDRHRSTPASRSSPVRWWPWRPSPSWPWEPSSPRPWPPRRRRRGGAPSPTWPCSSPGRSCGARCSATSRAPTDHRRWDWPPISSSSRSSPTLPAIIYVFARHPLYPAFGHVHLAFGISPARRPATGRRGGQGGDPPGPVERGVGSLWSAPSASRTPRRTATTDEPSPGPRSSDSSNAPSDARAARRGGTRTGDCLGRPRAGLAPVADGPGGLGTAGLRPARRHSGIGARSPDDR